MKRRAFLRLLSSVAIGGAAITFLDRRLQLGHRLLHTLVTPGRGLYRKTIISMGTFVNLTLDDDDAREHPLAIDRALGECRAVDTLMSSFKPDSHIARVNRCAGERSLEVDTRVCDVVAAAIDMGHRTGGIFDVTVLPLLRAYGFRDNTPRVPDPEKLATLLETVDYRRLIVDVPRCEIGIETRRAQIDLGGIAKGYAVDRAAGVLRSHGITRAVIEAGGDIFALGSPPDADGWPIGIQHPLCPDKLVACVRIRNQAIATSGNYERFVSVGNRRYGHLFDPREGCPSESALSATVIAPTSLEADALSTTAFLMGSSEGSRFLAEQKRVHGLFTSTEQDGDVEVRATHGFPFDTPGVVA